MASVGGIPVVALLAGAGAFLAVLLFGLAFIGGSDKELKRRVARVGAEGQKGRRASVAGKAASLRLDRADSSNATLDRLVKALVPNPERIRERLARTGRRIPLGQYVAANLLIAAVAWAALSLVLPAPLPLTLAVAVGLGVPHVVVKVMGDRRVADFVAQFPDAIDLIVRGLRSGLPVTESINAVARELPDPLGTEFRRVGDAVRLGQSLDAALWDVAKRIDTPEFRFLIIAMAIQRETGGNLAETLGNLSDLLRKRRQMKMKVRALSSEARASAYIVGALPFLMFGAISILKPDYAAIFLEDPRGQVMGAIALGMIIAGGLVMAKMVRFDI
ncbi:type II secretion system F family protein [Azospirillum sp.]|uniref:type II secretion system F family protein n=1 Tax=Azospirillum sp. TaxID=34012 RepID=UPI002D3B46FD|nr:type II secretion system F family protein [Azospirillum sp.]HYD67756.1 type II secretion system F family protein [Azospirillum sp.]